MIAYCTGLLLQPRWLYQHLKDQHFARKAAKRKRAELKRLKAKYARDPRPIFRDYIWAYAAYGDVDDELFAQLKAEYESNLADWVRRHQDDGLDAMHLSHC